PETLALIKKPPAMAFVRQANISNGPQQSEQRGEWRGDPTRILARRNPKIRQTNYWSSIAMNGWTAEQRKRQGAAIHRWKPWKRSTGPKRPRVRRGLPAPPTAAVPDHCLANWREPYAAAGRRRAGAAQAYN